MPRLPAALSVTRHDDRDVAVLAAGDELLDAVQHVLAAVAQRRRLQAVGLRADVRLGEAERAEHVAARERLQPLLLLRIVRPRHQDRADRAVVDADDRRGRAVAGGDLLEDDGEREVVEAGAVELGRHRDAVAAERGEALQLGLREVAVAVPLRRVRRDAVLHVAANRVLHGDVVGVEDHRARLRASARAASSVPVPLSSRRSPRARVAFEARDPAGEAFLPLDCPSPSSAGRCPRSGRPARESGCRSPCRGRGAAGRRRSAWRSASRSSP